ncbi:MAG: cytochrome b/b6 domain-containing protein [Gammaproteobacteria bacterium]
MSSSPSETSTGALVWDLPVRIFHWSLAVLVPACWVTQEMGSRWMTLHMWLGYAVGALILFRLAWGFLGTRHARFGDFLAGPTRVFAYFREWMSGRGPTAIGHDPAGGWWIVLLLALLAGQVATGMLNSDGALHAGPWHYAVPEDVADAAAAWHSDIFNLLILAVTVHVAAVLAHLARPGIDLVTPMFTGRKPWANAGIPGSRTPRAMLILVAAAAGIALLVWLAPAPDPADFGIY